MRRILIAALGPLALLVATLSPAPAPAPAPAATATSGWERLGLDGILVRQVAVDRQEPNTLHAIVGTDTQIVSNDRGQTWRTVPGDLRPFYAQDPNRPQTYFRWNPESSPTGGIQRSTDNGQTWSLVWRSPTRYASSYGIMAAPPAGAGVPSVVLASTFIDAGVPRAENHRLLRSLDQSSS